MTETSLLLVSGPCLIAALGALALFIAGTRLRAGSQAIFWGAALAAGALQWIILFVWPELPPGRVGVLLARMAGLFAVILYTQGLRVRYGEAMFSRALVEATLVAMTILVVLAAVPAPQSVHYVLPSILKAFFLAWATSRQLVARRRATPAEWALTLTMLVVMLGNIIFVVGHIRSGHLDDPDVPHDLANHAVVASPAVAAIALFSLLLIASDYARDRRRLVYTDSLTGVLNRAGFDAVLGTMRRRLPLTVAIADIDHFKAINDRYGHVAGDAVLTALAGQLTTSLRADEIAARVGGEEFALLLRDGGEAALNRIEAMRAQIGALAVEGHAGIAITVSFGITERRSREPLATTINRADSALYRSKHGGRNRATLIENA